MSAELLEIQPRELKFTFELKKQSSCSIRLSNIFDQYVAFKVKTTCPKKYCVRPNTGIIKPKSTCDFTVTMQAQRSAPSDIQCKDKFLIQSTVVPFGTTEEGITPSMFAKDSGKYIEENKLKVVLISPPHSPVLLPINGVLKQDPSNETSIPKDKVMSGVENVPPPHTVSKEVVGFKSDKDMEELRPAKDVELRPAKDEDLRPSKDEESKPAKDVEELKLKLSIDIEELGSRINGLESKLSKAELTITKLTEERSANVQEKETLEQELALLRRKSSGRRIWVGFPFLYVCMVALISLKVGYLLHP